MSLYKELKAAGIPIDSHGSDLYFKRTPTGLKILDKYPLQKENATCFVTVKKVSKDGTITCNDDVWMDVPFAYDPYWEKKGLRNLDIEKLTKNKNDTHKRFTHKV